MAPLGTPPPPPTTQRDGLLAGLSFGFGSIAVSEESNSTLNYQLQFGGFLSDQWALAVEFWGGSHDRDGYSLTNGNAGVTAQYWLSPSFWAKGGVGSASLEASFDDIAFERYSGAAILGGVGWDFYQRADFHFNLSFLLTIEGYEDTRDNVIASALQVGVQYY